MPLFENIEEFKNVDPALQWAIFIVACLIIVVALISAIVSIWLAIKYVVYNRTANKAGINGEQTARKILDSNGLNHIRVSVVGSLMFGNSYSHFFKKLELIVIQEMKTIVINVLRYIVFMILNKRSKVVYIIIFLMS